MYASDFGDLKIVPNRTQRGRDVWVVDPSKVAVAFLRSFEPQEIGRVGDATYKLVLADVVFTASGAMGPFRYAVLYNDTAASDELIGYWDYGSSITLASGDTFTVDYDATTGVLQIV
jgi:hypothetical protein